MATTVYVDGFNLYFGALKGTPFKWLDLQALCRHLLPKDDVTQIRYFTARVEDRPSDPQQTVRQATYWRALRTCPDVSIHLGTFKTRRTRMPLAQPVRGGATTVEVLRIEEKGSDVNLASHLLLDLVQQSCDTVVVISNDSDLRVPIRIAEAEFGATAGVVNPHPPRYRSRDLRATFFKQLRDSALAKSQFPDVLTDEHGPFRKPKAW